MFAMPLNNTKNAVFMAKKNKPGAPKSPIKRKSFNLSLREDVIFKIKTLAAKEKTTSNKIVESKFE